MVATVPLEPFAVANDDDFADVSSEVAFYLGFEFAEFLASFSRWESAKRGDFWFYARPRNQGRILRAIRDRGYHVSSVGSVGGWVRVFVQRGR